MPPDLWRRAPARARINLDPTYLRERLRRYARPECGPLFGAIDEVRRLMRPLTVGPMLAHLGGRVTVVLLTAEMRGEGTIHLRGALAGRLAATADGTFFRRRLASHPRGPGDPPIWRVDPGASLADAIEIAIDGGRLLVSSGDGLMSALLRDEASVPAGSVVSAELRPARMADLRAPLTLFEGGAGRRGFGGGPGRRGQTAALDKLASLLSSFRLLSIEGRLRGQRLEIEMEVRLR